MDEVAHCLREIHFKTVCNLYVYYTAYIDWFLLLNLRIFVVKLANDLKHPLNFAHKC